MPGYLSPQGPDRRSFTADGRFRTGDMAFVSGGALTVTGSSDDVIRIGGGIWHGHEIEAALAADVPFVERRSVAAVGVPDSRSEDESLTVFCDLGAATDATEAERLVRQSVAWRFGIPVAHVVALDADDFPRTRTGKPMRSALRARITGTDRGEG